MQASQELLKNFLEKYFFSKFLSPRLYYITSVIGKERKDFI